MRAQDAPMENTPPIQDNASAMHVHRGTTKAKVVKPRAQVAVQGHTRLKQDKARAAHVRREHIALRLHNRHQRALEENTRPIQDKAGATHAHKDNTDQRGCKFCCANYVLQINFPLRMQAGAKHVQTTQWLHKAISIAQIALVASSGMTRNLVRPSLQACIQWVQGMIQNMDKT